MATFKERPAYARRVMRQQAHRILRNALPSQFPPHMQATAGRISSMAKQIAMNLSQADRKKA